MTGAAGGRAAQRMESLALANVIRSERARNVHHIRRLPREEGARAVANMVVACPRWAEAMAVLDVISLIRGNGPVKARRIWREAVTRRVMTTRLRDLTPRERARLAQHLGP